MQTYFTWVDREYWQPSKLVGSKCLKNFFYYILCYYISYVVVI